MMFVCLVEIGGVKHAGPRRAEPRGSPAPSGSPPGRPRRLSRLQRRSGTGRGKHPPGHGGSVPPAARPEPLGGCSPALEGPGEEWEQEPTPLQKENPPSPQPGWSPRGAAGQKWSRSGDKASAGASCLGSATRVHGTGDGQADFHILGQGEGAWRVWMPPVSLQALSRSA